MHIPCLGYQKLLGQFFARIIWMSALLLFMSTTFVIADVTVEISDQYSAIDANRTFRIAPGDCDGGELPKTPFDDKYLADVKIAGGSVRAYVLDNKDIRVQNPNPRFLIDQTISRSKTLRLPAAFTDEGITLTFCNNDDSSVEVKLLIYRVGTRPLEFSDPVRQYVEIPVKAVSASYVLPKFKVRVQPCGFINAYSTPDVIICTELVADLWRKNLPDALLPIILHEMAHSLLYLWGLPGFDNEDIADEFAAAFLARYTPAPIIEYIKWLENKDSVTEAVTQIECGSRHTISIQRARNMREAMNNPEELMARWGRLLAPFARR
jgi:hypothetical protein